MIRAKHSSFTLRSLLLMIVLEKGLGAFGAGEGEEEEGDEKEERRGTPRAQI